MERGKRIKELRISQMLTLNDFAKKIGVSASNVGKMERGERAVSDKMIVRLKKSFELPDDYFEVVKTDLTQNLLQQIALKDKIIELQDTQIKLLQNT